MNVLMHSADKRDYPNTAFLNSVGARMDLSVVDWYLPIASVIIYISCKVNIFDRCLRKIGVEEGGDPVTGNRDHENIIRDGILVVKKGRRTLGLGGGDADDEEEREKKDAIARDRLKSVMARAQARREGRNPDEVAAMDGDAAIGDLGGEGGDVEMARVGGGGSYASGGSFMSSKAGMVSLDTFAGVGSVTAGGAGAGAGAPKGGLAALANRTGMNKLGAAFTQFGGALAGGFGTETGSGAIVDHGDDDNDIGNGSGGGGGLSSSASSSSAGGPPRPDMMLGADGKWVASQGGVGGFSRHDRATADLMKARGMPPPAAIQAPPTLAELLKGSRKL